MCYVPPYASETSALSFIDELTHMERDYARWQKLTFGAYQSQAKLFLKLKQEVLALKANVCAKDALIDELRMRNDMLDKQNRLLRLKLREKDEEDENDTDLKELIADLENLQS